MGDKVIAMKTEYNCSQDVSRDCKEVFEGFCYHIDRILLMIFIRQFSQ